MRLLRDGILRRFKHAIEPPDYRRRQDYLPVLGLSGSTHCPDWAVVDIVGSLNTQRYDGPKVRPEALRGSGHCSPKVHANWRSAPLAAIACLLISACGGTTVKNTTVIEQHTVTLTTSSSGQTMTTAVNATTSSAATSPQATAGRVESCPSTYGVEGSHPLPAGLTNNSNPSLGLVLYANQALAVLAPAGWTCHGLVGADGSGEITVRASDGNSAVNAQEGSACVSCNAEIACPLIPAAAKAMPAGLSCPTTAPKAEYVHRITATRVAFEDPPGVRGTGDPSGGSIPANGVLIYEGAYPEAFIETCALPASDHAECTTILDNFLARYPG